MFKDRKRWVRCSVLAALSAGFVMGTGVIGADANSGMYTVSSSYEYVTDENLDYDDRHSRDGVQHTSAVYVPADVSGNFIFIQPEDRSISASYHGGISEVGTGRSGNVIEIAPGYTGTVNIGEKTSDDSWYGGSNEKTWLDLETSGNGIKGAVINSSQEGQPSDPSKTKIIVNDNVQLMYRINNTTDSTIYGIYNSHGTVTAGNEVGINKTMLGSNENGIIGTNDDGHSTIYTSGILSIAGASTSVGYNLDLRQHFKSKGAVKGVISGIDSGRIEDTKRSTLNLGYSDITSIRFTGKGDRSSSSNVLDDENAFKIRGMYIADSDFTIGNSNELKVTLVADSTAATVIGADIRKSSGTIDYDFQPGANVDSGAAADEAIGLHVSDDSDINAVYSFDAAAVSDGYTKTSIGAGVYSHSKLKVGDYSRMINQGMHSDSHEWEDVASAAHVEGNSQVITGVRPVIQTRSMDKNVAKVVNIDLADSQMTLGDNAEINAYVTNLDYDEDKNAIVYGADVYKTSADAPGDAVLTIGKDSKVTVTSNNFVQTAGLRNSVNGTVFLDDGSSITVAQTAQSSNIEDEDNITWSDIQQGHSGNIAGYQGNQAKETTFGNGVSINIMGNTDTEGASAYGSDNASGNLDVRDNLTVNVNTKGYESSYGLSTSGDEGSTETGKELAVTVNSDKNSYGIYSTGSSKATIGDSATITVNGDESAYGVQNHHGANTTFEGAATITSMKKGSLDYAAASYDQDSLIDITRAGQKLVTGNLYTESGGTIKLSMGTGDSVLTGKSEVIGGTTNIEMSNGSLWNMTDSSEVTKLDLNSGAKVDMTYNPKGYHTLTIDNFTGNGGEFHMKSDLASMTDGDKVHITTSTPGSSGQISVYDQSLATGTMMTGVHHLLMVTDASENATFSGKDLDTGGLWNITPTVERGGTFTDANGKVVGSSNEWYLVQTAKKPNEDTTPIIDNIDNTYGLYRLSIDTLRQRLGDLRYRNRSDDKYDFWVRDRHGRFDGHGYDSKYNFLQIGVDTMPNEKSAYGFLVERGIAAPHFESGSGKNHTLAGALYATWIGDHGNYTDIVAKIGRNDTTLHTYGEYADRASYREDEKSLSVEYGKTLDIGSEGYFFEPQAQIVFGHLGSNSYTTRRGTHVHEDSFDSAIGRLGFVLGKKQKNGENPHDFYLKASILHEFGGDRDYSLRRVNAYGDEESLDGSYNYRDTWVEVGFGGNVKINDNTSFYADVERSFGSDYTKKWQINAGINWSF